MIPGAAPHEFRQPAPAAGAEAQDKKTADQRAAEQLAREFAESPIGFETHLPSADPAGSNSSNSSARPVPDWLRALPDDCIRGDECFQELLGDRKSLLEDDGEVNTRFAYDKRACPEELHHTALTLAVSMKTRNEAVMDLMAATERLLSAEKALKDARDALDVALAAADRNGIPLAGSRLQPLQQAIADAIENRDAAVAERDQEQTMLQEIQAALEVRHEAARRLILTPPEQRPRNTAAAAFFALPEPDEPPPEPVAPRPVAEVQEPRETRLQLIAKAALLFAIALQAKDVWLAVYRQAFELRLAEYEAAPAGGRLTSGEALYDAGCWFVTMADPLVQLLVTACIWEVLILVCVINKIFWT